MNEPEKQAAVPSYDYELGDPPKEIYIDIRGTKRGPYFIHDLSSKDSIDIFEPQFNGGEIEAREARRQHRNKIVSAVVYRPPGHPKGERITVEQAEEMSALLITKLYIAAQKHVNDVDDLEDDPEKKDSSQAAESTSGTS